MVGITGSNRIMLYVASNVCDCILTSPFFTRFGETKKCRSHCYDGVLAIEHMAEEDAAAQHNCKRILCANCY